MSQLLSLNKDNLLECYTMKSTVDALAVLVVLVLMFGVVDNTSCDSAPPVDGCSIPWGLGFWYQDIFESDCNKHDLCYTCGSYYNITKEVCDSRFLSDMRNTCKTSKDVTYRSWCSYVANLYYYGVLWFGGASYVNDSPSFCNGTWVPACIA